MSPEAQRIAIAEACGFMRNKGNRSWPQTWWMRPVDKALLSAAELPDYLNDLNAMHEAEETLDERGRIDWFFHICRTLHVAQTSAEAFKIGHATAAQRAEAFLRTLGKWEE